MLQIFHEFIISKLIYFLSSVNSFYYTSPSPLPAMVIMVATLSCVVEDFGTQVDVGITIFIFILKLLISFLM